MSLLNKKAPWIVASILAASTVFGQTNKCPPQKNFEQGYELMQNQMMAAYNAPARIDVRGAWDFYFNGAFTYWQVSQDNMEAGVVNLIPTTQLNGNQGTLNGRWIQADLNFKPGFQVGIGMNVDHDSWDLYAEYTWFRGSQTQSSTQSAASLQSIAPTWGTAFNTIGVLYSAVSQEWNVQMDIIDTELARSYYVGRSLSFRPAFGARAAWIRQSLHTHYVNDRIAAPAAPWAGTAVGSRNLNINQVTNSWGLGPRAGVYTNWMLGEGFRMYGNGFADILYTQYTKLAYKENRVTTPAAQEFRTTEADLNSVRTHLDLELGFGWGSYFDNNNWHVDLSAGYGFQMFFDQNMFRHYTAGSTTTTSVESQFSGDLFVQGLTANVRFDF